MGEQVLVLAASSGSLDIGCVSHSVTFLLKLLSPGASVTVDKSPRHTRGRAVGFPGSFFSCM